MCFDAPGEVPHVRLLALAPDAMHAPSEAPAAHAGRKQQAPRLAKGRLSGPGGATHTGPLPPITGMHPNPSPGASTGGAARAPGQRGRGGPTGVTPGGAGGGGGGGGGRGARAEHSEEPCPKLASGLPCLLEACSPPPRTPQACADPRRAPHMLLHACSVHSPRCLLPA